MTDAARALTAGHPATAFACMGAGLAVGLGWAVSALVCWRMCMALSRRRGTVTGLGM